MVCDIKGRIQTEGILKRISGPKRDKIIGSWRKMHNEELHNLYSLPNIIRMIKLSRVIWAGHVAHMKGRRGMYTQFLWKIQKERDD
jgi:hypothetical protein